MAASRQNNDDDDTGSMRNYGQVVPHNDDENENEDRNRNNNIQEYLPNVVRLEPDIGLGNHNVQKDRRRQNEPDHLPMRREDGGVGAVSFRHFLQNDSCTPSSSLAAPYPDLYRCSRQEVSSSGDTANLDSDNPDLPDFVQDHLAAEYAHMYPHNDDVRSPSSLPRNLPDFASCVHRNDSTVRSRRYDAAERQEERLNPPLPFDLTTNAVGIPYDGRNTEAIEATSSAGSSSQLPDFLSDSRVFDHDNSMANIPRENDVTRGLERHIDRHDTISMLRQENNSLRNQISWLQNELTKKDDRLAEEKSIKELEDIVMALEISKLQMSTDANTQTTSKNASDYEIASLRKELELAKKETVKLQRERIDSFADQCGKSQPSSCSDEKRTNLALKVQQMANVSEKLISELSKVIAEIRCDFDVQMPKGKKPRDENNDDEDDDSNNTIG